MKKIVRIFTLLMLVGLFIFVVGCGETKVTIESISVVSESIPSAILSTELDDKLDDIKINVEKSDDSVETINLSKSMISSSDLAKLSQAGSHEITINYEGFETKITIVITVAENPKTEDPKTEEEKIEYSVLVVDIANKPLGDFYITFFEGDDVVAEGYTGNDGMFKANLEANIYDVLVEGREGYYLNQDMYKTDLLGTQILVECELDSLAGIEAESTQRYALGDLMYDFTLTDTEGKKLNLYTLLETKKAVIINFWYTTCSACYYEFPYMVDAYNSTYVNDKGETVKYSDDIIIIAVNPGIAGNGDTLEDIKNFKQQMNISFNVAMDYDFDKSNLTADPALTTMFGINAYPTTVIIDSYGLIAEIGVGAVTALDKWTQTFDKYVAEDYYPEFVGETGAGNELVKPDIKQEDSSILEEAVNGTNYDGSKFNGSYAPEDHEKDAEYSWPWIVETFDGKNTIKPSNQDVNPSFSIVYTVVELKQGEVFTFDYYASTEQYDTLYVTVNGVIATSISGQSPDWETSYAYVALVDGEYEIGFCYYKDESYSTGEDAVYITNVRIMEISDIDKQTYIFRECATGVINEFTMSYTSYATVVYNEEDGYYHVDNVNGPLLLADMLSGTQWNLSSLYEVSLEGKCIGADGVDYNKVIEEYAIYASNSSVGYTPVTKKLADAIKQVVKALGDPLAANNQNQWLEVCVYYSAYFTDGELGVPTVGVCPFEPIMFEGNAIEEPATAEATFDRIILPRGFIFGFIPEKTGVYTFYSTEEELETVGWICDAEGTVVAESETGLRLFAQQSSNGQKTDKNFVAYVYLEAGQLYLYRAAFYDVYEYSTITVEMKYIADSIELLTVASPGFFTSSDDEMSDIISGNFVDVELGDDGYYHVVDSNASDDFVYCDMTYINNITGYSLLDCLSEKYNAFDFGKDEYGNDIYDENGYYRYTGYDEDYNLVRYFVCYDAEGTNYYVLEVGADGYTEENGYTYVKFDESDLESFANINCTQYVKDYVATNMITDTESELYGCVKVDEQFAYVLGLLMDKYTFANVENSWVKLCYYFKYIGA